ncbi:Ig-like domain-containing protein, partial [Escherichia coli]|uniref:Ig-like domain-containing protein n=1 Tax=Escherichia coli TaxID=562 RepID=UPI00192BC145
STIKGTPILVSTPSVILPAPVLAPSPNTAVDKTAPTLTLSSDTTSLAPGQTATLSLHFSEAPVGFSLADISVESGTLGALAKSSDTLVYTVGYTPAAGITDNSMRIEVKGGSYTDAAGNAGAAANLNLDVHTAPPVN